jgi:aldehyde:ferredoxin oxidoreductase
MTSGGFAGRIIHVDLTTGEIKKINLNYDLAEKFVGGLGLSIKIAKDEITPRTDPLSPENPIILGVGPLVGTNLPAVSRFYAVTKLPSSKTVGWSGGASNFGTMLKIAGYDHVVITGRAKEAVFLRIEDDDVAILKADKLWGKGISETAKRFWDEFGRDTGVITIGQAGENLVPFSLAYVDRISTLGRGGLGAVFGSKNLKAIIVKGSRGVKVSDKKRYNILKKDIFEKIRSYPYLKQWQELGLINSFPVVPVETYRKIFEKRIACISCPIGCKDVVKIADGEFRGQVTHSSSAINLFTPMMYGFEDYREAVKCVSILDEYGIDMFEFFGVMKFAGALYENGFITEDQARPKIAIDSLTSMEAWAKKIALRDGLGDVLAGGFGRIIDEFGKGAKELAPPLVKGMQPYAGPDSALPWELFGTMELGQVLDPRGPHVGSGGSPTYFAKRPMDVFPKHLTRMGVPDEAFQRILPGYDLPDDETKLNVGRLLRYSHGWFTTLGSLGICARGQINRFYNASFCAELYSAVTGIETDIDKLREGVDRAWTLLRIINIKEGIGVGDETPPKKWFEDPPFRDYLTEDPLTPEQVGEMIGDYYDEWGWDKKTGIPGAAVIKRLGLGDQ